MIGVRLLPVTNFVSCEEGKCMVDAQHSQSTLSENGAGFTINKRQVSRRTVLKLGAVGLAASTRGIASNGCG